MRILMITSEAVPVAKTGGLADVVSALSYALKKFGHDVRIVMPRYYKINKKDLTPIPGAMGVSAIESIGRKYLNRSSPIPMYRCTSLTTKKVLGVMACTVRRLSPILAIIPSGFRC